MYRKTFFSLKRANDFAATVNGMVWRDCDAFGQDIYIVEWR